MRGFDGLVKVLQFAGASGSDDRSRNHILHRTDHRKVVSGFGAVASLAGRKDHLHAETVDFPGPFDGVGAGCGPSPSIYTSYPEAMASF